jgi:ribonuclease P protein component
VVLFVLTEEGESMNRKYSLKDKREIERIVKAKKSVGNRFYAIYFQKAEDFKVAISPSRKIKTAVKRNYEKRVMREILRPIIPEIGCVHMLVVIKPTVMDLSFARKKEQILYLINKVKKEIS